MAPSFLFVHGAWHGAACWRPVLDELARRGVEATAVDLPIEDQGSGWDDYAAAAVAGYDTLEGDQVVVVGHSMGGMTIPLVAEQRPVAELVYVTAIPPLPGETMGTGVEGAFGARWDEWSRLQVAGEHGASTWPPDAAIEAFYHDCPPALASWAAGELRRQAWGAAGEPSPLSAVPDGPARYVVCEQDRVLSPAWQRHVAAPRAGAAVLTLATGHSPMLADPPGLVDLLLAP